MNKKKIIIIVAVLLAVGIVGNLFSGGGSVSSAEEGEKVARKVAQEIFSGKDYRVQDGSEITMQKKLFMVDVGENCMDHLGEVPVDAGEIDAYRYVMYQGTAVVTLFVSEDGRVIGLMGNDYYRLR